VTPTALNGDVFLAPCVLNKRARRACVTIALYLPTRLLNDVDELRLFSAASLAGTPAPLRVVADSYLAFLRRSTHLNAFVYGPHRLPIFVYRLRFASRFLFALTGATWTLPAPRALRITTVICALVHRCCIAFCVFFGSFACRDIRRRVC